jgi:X-Pro dipeptidyl-peptidase
MRRLSVAVVVGLSASVLVIPAPAGAAGPAYRLEGGLTQPVYSYETAIRETAWVDVGADLDRDGRPDRVAADIIRPAEPAAAGARVPVLMDISPYYLCCGRGNEAQNKKYDANGKPVSFPLFYDNYFVPRGYAVVLVDSSGTNRSTGCPDGGGPRDLASGRAVVDWLNGRAHAYSAPSGGSPMRANWSTGAVGIWGKSHDGWLANGIATTGVPGLRTVVSIAGVTDIYRTFNANGAWRGFPANNQEGPPHILNEQARQLCPPLLDALDRAAGTNGDWNAYWQQRYYPGLAGQVRASVFAIQGFGDYAVSPTNFGLWWEALGAHRVPRKAWLFQGGHVDPFDLRRAEFVSTVHRWFDRWLLGIDNGIDREPAVTIEHAPDQWRDEPTWPAPNTRPRTWWPRPGTATGAGLLSTDRAPATATASFVDNPDLSRFDWVREPDTASDARVAFQTLPLERAARISGTGSVTVTVRSSKPVARVGVALVDYGPATIRDYVDPFGKGGIRNLDTRSCWGQSSATDSACYLDTATATTTVDHEIVATGWADIGHHATLRHQVPLRPDRFYTMTFQLSTMDHIVPAGHRIGLVIGGSDWFEFLDPGDRPTLTLDLTRTRLTLPVAG